MFFYYIYDLETHVSLFKLDDSTLFEICNTNEISEIQESIDKAADWTSMNCMKINSKKSKEMIICFTHDVKRLAVITLRMSTQGRVAVITLRMSTQCRLAEITLRMPIQGRLAVTMLKAGFMQLSQTSWLYLLAHWC